MKNQMRVQEMAWVREQESEELWWKVKVPTSWIRCIRYSMIDVLYRHRISGVCFVYRRVCHPSFDLVWICYWELIVLVTLNSVYVKNIRYLMISEAGPGDRFESNLRKKPSHESCCVLGNTIFQLFPISSFYTQSCVRNFDSKCAFSEKDLPFDSRRACKRDR